MAIKYYCDRCGSECNERFIVEITKDSTEFQYEHLDLCETCKTGLNLYLKMYGNCGAKNGRITKGEMIMSEVKNYPPYLDYPKPYKAKTNADRIRAMSDEELANLLTGFANNGVWATEIGRKFCYQTIANCLQQPAEEIDDDE